MRLGNFCFWGRIFLLETLTLNPKNYPKLSFIRIQIWSLLSQSVSVLSGVKSLKRGTSICHDRVAILESRTKTKSILTSHSDNTEETKPVDYCCILKYNYQHNSWSKDVHFKLHSKNATDIDFTSDGEFLRTHP